MCIKKEKNIWKKTLCGLLQISQPGSNIRFFYKITFCPIQVLFRTSSHFKYFSKFLIFGRKHFLLLLVILEIIWKTYINYFFYLIFLFHLICVVFFYYFFYFTEDCLAGWLGDSCMKIFVNLFFYLTNLAPFWSENHWVWKKAAFAVS